MKHRIPLAWGNRLPFSIHTHTSFFCKRKRFLAFARNDTLGRIVAHQLSHCRIDWRLSETLYPTPPPEGCFSSRETSPCPCETIHLSYRHPERSRGIFVAASFVIHTLIRLHEAPYPPLHGETGYPFPFTRIHRFSANEKDVSLSLEMTHGAGSPRIIYHTAGNSSQPRLFSYMQETRGCEEMKIHFFTAPCLSFERKGDGAFASIPLR